MLQATSPLDSVVNLSNLFSCLFCSVADENIFGLLFSKKKKSFTLQSYKQTFLGGRAMAPTIFVLVILNGVNHVAAMVVTSMQ